MIEVAADGTGTHTTIEAGVAALRSGSHMVIHPKVGGQWEMRGPLTLPNVHNVTIEGSGGKHGTILWFPGDGIRWDGTARNQGWIIRTLRISGGGGLDAQSRGLVGVGLDMSGLDRSTLQSVRVVGFGTGIRADGSTHGSQHTMLSDMRVTNCGTGVAVIGGRGGVTQWHWYGGEVSGNGVGLAGATGVGGFLDGWTMLGTAFETNSVAIRWGGNHSDFRSVRFEGNIRDAHITGTANELRTLFNVKGS